MKEGRKKLAVIGGLAVALAVVLAVTAGLAFAQTSDDQAAPPPGQDGPGMGARGPMRAMHAGEVTKVDGNTITVKGPNGQEKSFNVDDNTRYLKRDGDGSLADVTVGEHIGVRLARPLPTDGSNPVAKAIVLDLPAPGQHIVGDVTAVDGDTVTIHTENGDQQVQLPAITPGMRLGVQESADGTVRGIQYDPPQRPAPPAGAPADEQPDSGQQT